MSGDALNNSRRPVRVLVVDDDPCFAEMLTLLLAEGERVAIVGTARHGAEGVELALRLRPDVIFMDVQMPVMDGFEATRRICTQGGSARVVIITGDPDPSLERQANAAGAARFLRKGCEPQALLEAVTTATKMQLANEQTIQLENAS